MSWSSKKNGSPAPNLMIYFGQRRWRIRSCTIEMLLREPFPNFGELVLDEVTA